MEMSGSSYVWFCGSICRKVWRIKQGFESVGRRL